MASQESSEACRTVGTNSEVSNLNIKQEDDSHDSIEEDTDSYLDDSYNDIGITEKWNLGGVGGIKETGASNVITCNEVSNAVESKRKKNHKCKFCDKTYRSPKELQAHESAHVGEKLYECDLCPKRYFSSTSLYNHKRITHLGGRPYKKIFECDQCPKSFVSASHLVIHKRRHTGEKPFTCGICDKSFCDSSTLYKHRRTHTDEKPYQCKYCLKFFARSYSLAIHERIHTGDKPYQCGSCGECFQKSIQLRNHERDHTGVPKPKPHQCDECELSFSSPSGLTYHKRIHSGEKPFECVCGKKFSNPGNLRTHEKRVHGKEIYCQCDHLGAQPSAYKCLKCGKEILVEAAFDSAKHVKEGLDPGCGSKDSSVQCETICSSKQDNSGMDPSLDSLAFEFVSASLQSGGGSSDLTSEGLVRVKEEAPSENGLLPWGEYNVAED